MGAHFKRGRDLRQQLTRGRKRLIFAVVAAGLAAGTSLVTAQPASASAYTCAFGSNITIVGLPTIPTVQFWNGVNGTGTYVSSTYKSFLSPGVICNYKITSKFFAASGSSNYWYRTFESP